MAGPSETLTELQRLADEAGRLAQSERARLARELKSDGSIVTNADKAVETWLRNELTSFIPGTTVWGEEFGFEDAGTNGRWLVDPVDGTSNFAFGSPLWGVSIGFEVGGRLKMGAVALPDLRETFLAEDGGGAFLNGELLPPIPAGPIRPEELTSYNDTVVRTVTSVPGKMRLSGAFVVDGTFTVRQRYRALVAIREKLYDVAACVVMAREVGADVRYIDGSPFDEKELLHDKKIGRLWGILPRDSGWVTESSAL
ncbi:inositol monophosphatase family protein [bacterium]|nr:MAG: inositol monophosphatase family protein [bacterium]